MSQVENGRWTEPERQSLSGGLKQNEMEAFFSRDGQSVFFATYDESADVRIWVAEIGAEGLHQPAPTWRADQ